MSPMIAAGAIILGFGLLFYIMPKIMIWLAGYSVWLAATFGMLGVLSFFLIFWLRARYQRSHPKASDQA
jgi:hypothetical protein